jgi:hypothetical protein
MRKWTGRKFEQKAFFFSFVVRDHKKETCSAGCENFEEVLPRFSWLVSARKWIKILKFLFQSSYSLLYCCIAYFPNIPWVLLTGKRTSQCYITNSFYFSVVRMY